MNDWEKDEEYEEVKLKEVTDEGDGWNLEREDGWNLFVKKEPETEGIELKAGMTARFYGEGSGRPVRGVVVDAKVLYYRTKEEQEELHRKESEKHRRKQKREFKKNKAQFDEDYNNLPEVFQRRLDRFRNTNPDFRWKFEAYEMFTCKEAVNIAEIVKKGIEDGTFKYEEDMKEAFGQFKELPYEEQIKLGMEDGHSGNTFGCAVLLAYFYVSDPEMVVKSHGALAPLVGCKEYGCPHDNEAKCPNCGEN